MLQINPIAATARCALLLAGLALPPRLLADETPRATPPSTLLSPVEVNAATAGYAVAPDYQKKTVTLGPLSKVKLLDTPYSVSVIPQDLIVNQQATDANELLR